MSDPVLHLASSSPRRRELLTALGLEFSHAGVAVDESAMPCEAAEDLVVRLAIGKARAACESGSYRVPVLGADTVVTVDGQIFGKPGSREEALEMLASLSGRTHEVLSGVALVTNDELETAISRTVVQFREIDPDEAEAYWHSGEPAGKAGAYAVQGLGGVFVSAINGSYTGVVGLPVFETAGLLRRAGIRLPCMPDDR